jgi:hypothetical protein
VIERSDGTKLSLEPISEPLSRNIDGHLAEMVFVCPVERVVDRNPNQNSHSRLSQEGYPAALGTQQ